jgi:hypothetical protein
MSDKYVSLNEYISKFECNKLIKDKNIMNTFKRIGGGRGIAEIFSATGVDL